jgi:hypothetical protein
MQTDPVTLKAFLDKLIAYVDLKVKNPFLRFALEEAEQLLLTALNSFVPSSATLTPQQIIDELFAFVEATTTSVLLRFALETLNHLIDLYLASFLASQPAA